MNIYAIVRIVMLISAPLSCCAVSLAGSSNPEFVDAAQSVKEVLGGRRYDSVVVAPRFAMILDRGDQSMVASLARNAERALADSLRHALQFECGSTTPRITVRSDLKSIDILDKIEIDDTAALQKAAKDLQVGAIVFGSLLRSETPDIMPPQFGNNGAFEVECLVVDGESGAIVGEVRKPFALSIAGAAYFGDSFELRRWRADTLLNVGIHSAAASMDWFTSTDKSTRGQFPNVCRAKPHPLADPACAFQMRILVDGKERPVRFIGQVPYVALDPGETFVINLANKSEKNICLAVFVDGVNALGEKVEHPANCRYWRLERRSESNVRGWYVDSSRKDKFNLKPFEIGAAQLGPAVQQGNIARLGQITAVMYTSGPVAIDQQLAQVRDNFYVPGKVQRRRAPNGEWIYSKPPDAIQQKYVTIAGPSRVVAKTLVATAPPDLVLASITVRYDTTAGVSQAASKLIGSGVDELREGGAAVPQGNAVGARCPWQSRPSVLDRSGIAVRANVVDEVSEGVLVTQVIDNSPGTYIYDRYAKRHRLIPGRDVITFLDDVPVDSVEAFESKIMAAGVRRVKLSVRDLSNGGFHEYIMWLR